MSKDWKIKRAKEDWKAIYLWSDKHAAFVENIMNWFHRKTAIKILENTVCITRTICALDAVISELEGKLEKLIEKDVEMRRKVEICCAYKGVGNVTATQLLAHIPELGKLRKNEIVSLAGCAHFARDNRTQRDIDQPKETAGSL